MDEPSSNADTMSTSTKILVTAGALVTAFLAYGMSASNTPDGQARAHERTVIERCWSNQERQSLSAGSAQSVARVCEQLEERFRAKWNREP